MLTKKQKDLLIYIHTHMQGSDLSPSFDEMREALGLKSKSGIHRLISALEERGYITRLPHRARALEITRLPDDVSIPAQQKTAAPVAPLNFETGEIRAIPLHGKIAAGTPIEAVRDEINLVHVPSELAASTETYALTVDGDSMIQAGIHDGDTVIIERCSGAPIGTIIVALVDEEEVTLKRLRRAGSKIVLEPENDAYEPQVLDPQRVQIQGRLVGLMRSYH